MIINYAFCENGVSIRAKRGRDPRRVALMRVGDFQMALFSNNYIMPVQMAEAARAFFKCCQHEHGSRLLEAVAWACTLHTEAPGNFPKHLSEDGKGEANFLFGNPIGSFIYAVVDGLFGLSWSAAGETIAWQPVLLKRYDLCSPTTACVPAMKCLIAIRIGD